MTSSRSYLIRALYDWILENDCTPYVLVDATRESVDVPLQYVKDGQIVLNVSPSAVVDLKISNDDLRFNARFSGVATDVYVPIHAALGIYARENGQGMLFENDMPPLQPVPETDTRPERKQQRPQLKIVK
ncbi:MAG: ClpXP protease specificity-enhancing factor [Pseudomonadales bacterium]